MVDNKSKPPSLAIYRKDNHSEDYCIIPVLCTRIISSFVIFFSVYVVHEVFLLYSLL